MSEATTVHSLYSSHDFGEHGNTRAGDGSQLPGVLIRIRK